MPKSLYFSMRQKLVHRMQKRPDKLSKNQINSLINEYFIDDIKKLEQLISKDLSHWYNES